MTALQKVTNEIESGHSQIMDMIPVGDEESKIRLIRVALSTFRTTPKLHQCTPGSIISSLMKAFKLGLEPGSLQGAHLVSYGTECTLIVGFRGLLQILYRNGSITHAEAEVVRDNDDWGQSMDGFTHHFDPFATNEARGDVVGAWCRLHMTSGLKPVTCMNREDLEAVRGCSAAWARGGSGPWADWPTEMAKKSCVIRACKLLDLNPEERQVLYEAGGDGEPPVLESSRPAHHSLRDVMEADDDEQPGPETEAPPTHTPPTVETAKGSRRVNPPRRQPRRSEEEAQGDLPS